MMFEFKRDFAWWGPSRSCQGCALVLYVFRRGQQLISRIPADAVVEAEKQGAGQKVDHQ